MPDAVWIESNGGPLLFLPESLLPSWSGTDAPTDGRIVEAAFRWNPTSPAASDYDRACDVADWAAVLPVGAGWGLVLGDEPSSTSWRPAVSGDGGVFARWVYAESDAAAEQALATVPDNLTWEALADFRVVTSPLILFDAAEPGLEPLGARAQIQLAPGAYAVAHARYQPDSQTEFTLVRLLPRAV
jgi:hypothetical protein